MRFMVFFVLFLFLFGFGEVRGQVLGGSEINLVAQKTFEWRKKEGLYVAEGEVTLSREGDVVQAERVLVYYRELDGEALASDDDTGSFLLHRPEVYRLVMEDEVFVSSREGQMTAKKAVYELDPHVFVATGGVATEGSEGQVKVEFSGDRVIKADRVSYWIEKNLLVGEGRVLISGLGVTFLADRASAFFEEDEDGDIVIPVNWQEKGEVRMSLRRVEIDGNLRVDFRGGVLEGRQGFMDVSQGIFEICGRVKAKWLSMVLESDCVDVDMRSYEVRLVDTEGENEGIEMRVPFSRLRDLAK